MASNDVSRLSATGTAGILRVANDRRVVVTPVNGRRATLGAVVGVALGCMALCVSAQVRVPVPGTDVPMTLQHLAVLLVGLSLPARRAAAATMLYLACGAVGFGVFAHPAGLTGSTAGYLFGFVVAAWLVSRISAETRSFGRLFVGVCAGTLAIFAMGVLWRVGLVLLAGGVRGHVVQAIFTGLLPFVGKSLVTMTLAVVAAWSWRNDRLIPRRRSYRPAD